MHPKKDRFDENSIYFLKREEVIMSNLKRFIDAEKQDFDRALSEIQAGQKQSHWMWYIFPQIQGLGFSSISEFYSIHTLEEAVDFLKDPYLGKNLITISDALLKLDTNDPHEVFGSPDDLKLCSSMTLFEIAAKEADGEIANTDVFTKVLEKFYSGKRDQRTIDILNEKK